MYMWADRTHSHREFDWRQFIGLLAWYAHSTWELLDHGTMSGKIVCDWDFLGLSVSMTEVKIMPRLVKIYKLSLSVTEWDCPVVPKQFFLLVGFKLLLCIGSVFTECLCKTDTIARLMEKIDIDWALRQLIKVLVLNSKSLWRNWKKCTSSILVSNLL